MTEFVRDIIGLNIVATKAVYANFLDTVDLDANQIYFVNQIIEYIIQNGVIKDMSVLQEASFTDKGRFVGVFSDITFG